jgi:branched-chain amino acid transport system permease protein
LKPSIYGLVVVLLAIFPVFFRSPYVLYIAILTFIYIIVAESLRTITISGQFPLAHGAFFGLGAYAAGMASRWLDWPPYFTIPAAAVTVTAISVVIGYPFSRLRALYYAMGTLFFGIGLIYIIEAGGIWSGGYQGLVGIHPMFATSSKIPYYYFFLGLTVVCCIALYRFEFSRIGMNLKAIAQSHTVASSVGINESFYRVLAVAVGCFFAGLAGAAFAHYNLILSPFTFDFMATLWFVMYVFVGGIDSFAGPIIGTAVLVVIPELFRGLKIYSPYVAMVILLLVVYLMPKGLASLPRIIRSWYSDRSKGEKVVTT